MFLYMSIRRYFLAAALISFMPAAGALANIVILQDGRRIQADSIRFQERTEEYIIVGDVGTFPIPMDQVRDVQVSEPVRWQESKQLLIQGRYDAAVSILRDIIRDYNRLGWDNRGRDLLAQAYIGSGEHVRAIATYEELFERISPDIEQLRNYWEALLSAERFSVLEDELGGVISDTVPDKKLTATAFILRGRLHAARGNNTEALLDYLRTHVLFKDVDEIQPEALYLAAERLEALRDDRAGKLRDILRGQYPDSEYAQRLQ